ncbi:cytochrome c biogenesis CcdA family protein [soil metagenome]
MLDGAFALAFGAGLLAAVNPCGFALLPAYVSLLVLGQESGDQSPLRRALVFTVAMALGFAAVFAVFGLVISPVAASAQQYLPWFTVLLGVVLVVVGGWLLSGRSISLPRWGGSTGRPVTGSFRSMAGFGAAYAVASLSCTIAPFLAVVIAAFRTESVWAGVGLFLTYAAGMACVVGLLAVAVALAEQGVVTRMRAVARWTPMVGGAVLALAGGYVAYYGWWEIRVLGGADPSDPVVDAAAEVQRVLARAVDGVGLLGWAVVAALLAVALVASLAVRRRARSLTPR